MKRTTDAFNLFLLCLTLLPFPCAAFAGENTATLPPSRTAAPSMPPLRAAASEWDALLQSITYGRIEKYRARAIMKDLRPRLDRYFLSSGAIEYSTREWVFPIEGYGYRSIEKYYVVRGFDFFSPVRHHDHPANDIFIRDRNQDSLDDRTGKPVRVLSMSSGIVVGKRTGWLPGSEMRGGNCLWVYDPVTKGLFYYAHLQDIYTNIGDVVEPGIPLGTVGRTGRNANAQRSPTHLHLMYLKYPDNGCPYPLCPYTLLVKSKVEQPSDTARTQLTLPPKYDTMAPAAPFTDRGQSGFSAVR